MRFRKSFALVPGFALALLVAGCGPTDPLDIKIRAHNAADYDDWLATHYRRLPEGIAQEYNKAFLLIKQTSPRGSSSSPDPGIRDGTTYVCQKLDGRTVRRVIADGYELANTTLQRSISNEIENAKRTLERADKADGDEAFKLREKAGRQMKLVEAMRAQIATNQELIARYTAR